MTILQNKVDRISNPLQHVSELAFQLGKSCIIVSDGFDISKIRKRTSNRAFLLYYKSNFEKTRDFNRLKRLMSLGVPITVHFDLVNKVNDEYGSPLKILYD